MQDEGLRSAYIRRETTRIDGIAACLHPVSKTSTYATQVQGFPTLKQGGWGSVIDNSSTTAYGIRSLQKSAYHKN